MAKPTTSAKTAQAKAPKAPRQPPLPKDANKDATAKLQSQKRGDQAPEAKSTVKAQKAATEKLFADADEAIARGHHPDLTVEQHENQTRRAALGW